MQVAREAEKVRLAALALIKAKRALIREYPHRDPDGRHSWNLQDEEQRWLAVSTEVIIEQRGREQDWCPVESGDESAGGPDE